MTDKEKIKDLIEKVQDLRSVVKTLENKDVKNTLDFHLSRFESQVLKAAKVKSTPNEWDTFSYNKERCIAP